MRILIAYTVRGDKYRICHTEKKCSIFTLFPVFNYFSGWYLTTGQHCRCSSMIKVISLVTVLSFIKSVYLCVWNDIIQYILPLLRHKDVIWGRFSCYFITGSCYHVVDSFLEKGYVYRCNYIQITNLLEVTNYFRVRCMTKIFTESNLWSYHYNTTFFMTRNRNF